MNGLRSKLLALGSFVLLSAPAQGWAQSQPGSSGSKTGSSTSSQTGSSGSTTDRSQAGSSMDRSQSGSMAHGGKEMSDAHFLTNIHRANQMEIEMAKLAKENSSSPQVKKFSDRIIDDHKKGDDMVIDLAKRKNIDIKAEDSKMDQSPGPMMKEHQETMEKLKSLKGAEFDREYAKAMVKDHEKVIGHLTAARTRVKDPDITALIDKLMPTLKEHLAMAQKLQAQGFKARRPRS